MRSARSAIAFFSQRLSVQARCPQCGTLLASTLRKPRTWRTLATSSRQGETTMFVRNAWYVAALLDMCCHRGAPLHMGKVIEEGLQCGYHGLIFDRSGACVRVPGQTHILERTRVRGFPVVEQDAFVWIWMGDPAKADVSTIVPWPYHNDAKNWPHKHTVYPIKPPPC